MHSTGTYETRIWTSQIDPQRSAEINVFIPNRLSSDFGAGDSDALREVERLLAKTSADPALAQLGPILTRSEGIASSRIEGLMMSTRRIYEAQHRSGDVDDRSAQQIVGNMNVMSEILAQSDSPLTHSLLHGWHRRVMDTSRLQPSKVGSYRTEQGWIGGRADSPVGANFVPPPPELVESLMTDLVRFANTTDLPPIVQAAVVHAQFETIHPYADGNGRVGRALIYWVLASRGALSSVAPPISPIIVDDRDRYVSGLTAYRDGQPDVWIDTLVSLLEGACAYSLLLAPAIQALEKKWRALASDVRSGSVDHEIISHLAELPVLDATTVAGEFGVSNMGARDALVRLADRGIVVERPLRKGRRGRPARVFEAEELFELLDEPVRLLASRLQSSG